MRKLIRSAVSLCVCWLLFSTAAWADELVTRTNIVGGVTASAGTLTKTGSNGYNAGAVSAQVIRDGFGYVEFTVTTNKEAVCGLSNGDTNQSYTDLDFGIITDD